MFELLLITDPNAPRGLVGSVSAALEGVHSRSDAERVAVQLRAKQLSRAVLEPIAAELRALTRERGVALLINGDLDLALAIRADGVHLPESGPPATTARLRLGEHALIGASCHDPAGLERAAEGGADYATLSPVFDSPGKSPALGIVQFAHWAQRASLPVYALGGVRAEHATELARAGARGLAVIGAVFAAPDPGAAVRGLLDALLETRPGSAS